MFLEAISNFTASNGAGRLSLRDPHLIVFNLDALDKPQSLGVTDHCTWHSHIAKGPLVRHEPANQAVRPTRLFANGGGPSTIVCGACLSGGEPCDSIGVLRKLV